MVRLRMGHKLTKLTTNKFLKNQFAQQSFGFLSCPLALSLKSLALNFLIHVIIHRAYFIKLAEHKILHCSVKVLVIRLYKLVK